MRDKPVVYFYRKEECSLCAEMARELAAWQSKMAAGDSPVQFEIVERDIEDDPDWLARYREYVPLLVVGQHEVCYYFFDGEELLAALTA